MASAFIHMKRSLLLAIVSLSSILDLRAQHCGWDNCYIIVLDVRDSETGKKIDGLRITLADSTGKPYTSEWNYENHKQLTFYKGTDTLKFGQNLKKESEEFHYYNGPFSFGLGDYMLLVYYNNYPGFNKNGTDLIVVRDTDGDNNAGRFEKTAVYFNKSNIVPLCLGMPVWHNEHYLDSIKVTAKLKPLRK